MGVVWRAMDEVLGREVALKELRTYTDAGGPELDDLRTRMRREARAAARVRHPGVIAVHDIAQHEGRPVIVMELVEGPSLDDVLRGRGPLGPVEAARIGASVLDALAAAHRVGVLHRDVKPGNILLEGGSTTRAAEGEGEGEAGADGAGGRVVLTDFGIAAVEDPGDGSATRLTGSGELVGSLDYLAPERARGEDPGPASDVWALGATLYAAVEGASPFRRTSTWSTLNAIVVDPLPEPRRAGPLGPALAELMEKDPARRADAERAAALLSAVASGRPLPTSPDTLRLGRRAPDPAPSGEGAGVGAGVGSPPDQPAATGAGAPQGPAAHVGASPPGPVRDGAASGGRRRRIVVAAAVAAVVLAGAGVTYAVVGHGAGSGDHASATGGKGEAAAEGGTRGEAGGGSTPSPDGSAKDEADKDGGAGGAADGEGDAEKGKDDGGSTDSGSGSGADKGDGDSEKGGDEGSGGGDGDGASGGGGGGGGGGDTDPAPVCHDLGGGKYNCEVWKDATSYDSAHTPVGTLKSGVNYFYCQTKLSHRETYGKWTNVWWAKTDDDSGNAGVFVSAVYLKGGDNDKPLPGLPTC
ncbi:serine/threonine protein kinase [Streptomyces daliensis]|uniref:non-specific serine/threonine protein kinase n=1 Tax=Streptomyces daliensis TaxID=299421 RepID=A0A8T4ILZ5_9ACTN|nr:serine/threonine protein kinase [Streptomyces daliensis]